MRPSSTIALCLAVAATAAGAGFIAGRWSRLPRGCAIVRRQAPVSKPWGDSRYVAQGRLTVDGLVVRADPASDERLPSTRVIIVNDGDLGEPGNYEVYADRGLYQVIRGAKPVPFAVMRIINPDRAAPLAVGQRVSLRGTWGEVDSKGGSTASLPDLGQFVTELD